MKRAFNIIGLVLALLLAFSSCQKAPFLTFTGQKSFTFKDAGGSETITFSCNRAWTVTSSESWLTVSPAKGEANEEGAKVTITCAANTTYDPRTATVTISSEGLTETISVSQDTNYGILSEPTTFNLTNAAQNIEVEVKANVEYTIAIDDACKDWISQAGTKALSSTKLTFSIAANESYDDREGKITISQKGSSTSVQPQVITVKQSQTNGLFITTPEYELSNESHDLTVEVKANINYEVTSEVDWIKYEASNTKALSATTFTLKVDKNETYDQRVGKVKVKGGGLEGIITITQAENLGLFVSPTEVQISKDAQEVEVEVQANVEYDIVVPEDAKGMITTIKTEGGETKSLTAKKVRFGVSENPKYKEREASVTFKQKNGELCGTVKISQDQRDTLFILPTRDSVSYEGGMSVFTVTSNIPYEVKVEEDLDWITVVQKETKGETQDGLITYEIKNNVDQNESITPRYATINISSENGLFEKLFIIAQGGVPVISFKDKYAKLVCVGEFDSNSDGEVSIIEAARVEKIESNFFGDYKTYITSFDELSSFISVKSLDSYAFSECSNLKSIKLPAKLTRIHGNAFNGCSSLTFLSIPSSVILNQKDEGMFYGCSKLENIEFEPENKSTMLPDWCFYALKSLKKVVLPTEIQEIGAEAFAMCESLETITIPNSVTKIGAAAFEHCYKITQIEFPEGVKEIPNAACLSCFELENLIFPKSVEVIAGNSFERCSSIKKVICKATTPPIMSGNAFESSPSAALYVPSSALSAYDSWADYFGGGIHPVE